MPFLVLSGGMSKMLEYIPVTDKSNPLTTVLKDNLVLVCADADD